MDQDKVDAVSAIFKAKRGPDLGIMRKLKGLFEKEEGEPREPVEYGEVEELGEDWDSMHGEFMANGMIEDLGDEELMKLYTGLRDWKGETREEIIEELMRYRERKLGQGAY